MHYLDSCWQVLQKHAPRQDDVENGVVIKPSPEVACPLRHQSLIVQVVIQVREGLAEPDSKSPLLKSVKGMPSQKIAHLKREGVCNSCPIDSSLWIKRGQKHPPQMLGHPMSQKWLDLKIHTGSQRMSCLQQETVLLRHLAMGRVPGHNQRWIRSRQEILHPRIFAQHLRATVILGRCSGPEIAHHLHALRQRLHRQRLPVTQLLLQRCELQSASSPNRSPAKGARCFGSVVLEPNKTIARTFSPSSRLTLFPLSFPLNAVLNRSLTR